MYFKNVIVHLNDWRAFKEEFGRKKNEVLLREIFSMKIMHILTTIFFMRLSRP